MMSNYIIKSFISDHYDVSNMKIIFNLEVGI